MKRRQKEDLESLVLAILLSVIIMVGWQYFIENPRQKAAHLHAQKVQAQTANAAGTPAVKAQEKEITLPREDRLKESARITITTDRLHGSIALKGLRFDDLRLAKYRETIDPKSPEVVLFSPAGGDDSYFAEIGWLADNGSAISLPDADTIWSADATSLDAQHPINLQWKNPQGVQFNVRIALDDNYMFTVTQSVLDATGAKLPLRSYAYINRVYDIVKHPSINILHEGPIGVFDATLHETSYKKLIDEKTPESFDTQSGGWLGITDKYWLAAIVPDAANFSSHFTYYVSKARAHYQTEYVGPAQAESTLHVFAGAKELALLDSYADTYHIPLFDRAVDFGWFYFLTKPIFLALTYFHALVGNFGIAILLLTVLVKLLMFPLANKSFRAMSIMKTLAPKMQQIRDLYKDDKMKMNQEIAAMYKREQVNPAAGCLPMFIQIPVFFSLYKVLYVTIEMRHAPFFGWVHDLSVADPTNIFTLFGLLQWSPPGFMHLGIWPLVMCATMVIQQFQAPPPPDPTQAKMMKMLPFFMLFVFGSFPAGLVIYWCWSNTLTILQQWYFIRTHRPKTRGQGIDVPNAANNGNWWNFWSHGHGGESGHGDGGGDGSHH